MAEPELPERADDLALARVLEGLGPADEADPAACAAHERATADVDAIARALGLIGDALGAEPVGAAGAVRDVEPIVAEEVVAPASGVVVPLRRRPTWAPLAAAASIVVVLGVGTVVVSNHDGVSGSASSVAQAPAAAPEAQPMSQLQGHSLMAVPAPAAPAAAAPAVGTSASSAGVTAKSAAGKTAPSFAAAVGCARGILLGKVVSITGGGGQYTLVLQVIEWISAGSGTSVTYEVGSAYAADDSTTHRLTVGQRRVFIVPADPTAQIRAYPDSASLRSRISQAQATGQSCG